MATKVKARPHQEATEKKHSSLISDKKLQLLYTTMLKCRMLDERARLLFQQKRAPGNYYSFAGHEAAAVATTIDLRPEDTVGLPHRDLVTGFIKGVPLNVIFTQLFARTTGPDKVRSIPGQHGFAPWNVISPSSDIAAQLNIATGVALANKQMQKGNIAVAFSDDSSASWDLLHEAMNFAAVHDLPIIFVVQNDLLTGAAPLQSQAKVEDISARTQAYDFPGIPVDGNDVVAVYRVAQESMAHARQNGGPTLIECKRYHLNEAPGNKKADDPIANMEEYLTRKGLFDHKWKDEVVNGFKKELDAAVKFAEKSR